MMWKEVILLCATCMMLNYHTTVTGAKLKCNYVSGDWSYSDESLYVCYFQNYEIFTGSRVSIDAIEGTYSAGKNNDDVTGIYIGNSLANVFPENVASHFKNLIGIHFAYSSLQELHQRDLQSFPKLKYAFIYHNKITALDKDLFQYNPDLKVIYMKDNQISHIDPNVFDGLSNLNHLWLSGNKCKVNFNDAETRSAVLSVIKQIQNGGCCSDEYLQRKKDQKVAEEEKIKNITQQQAANEEFKSNYDNLKQNLTSMINEKNLFTKDFDKLQAQHAEVVSSNEKCNIELTSQNDKLTSNLNELQGKYKSLLESKKLGEEREEKLTKSNTETNNKLQTLLVSSNGLKDKLIKSEESNIELKQEIINIMKKLDDLRIKHENLLQSKLDQSEKLVEKLIERKSEQGQSENYQTEDEQQKNIVGGILTLYFGNNQAPIILVN